MYLCTFAKSASLGITSRFTPGLGAYMTDSSDYKREYASSMVAWSTYKRWERDYPADDIRHQQAANDLRELESKIAELRKLANIDVKNDPVMVAAVKDILEGKKTTQDFLDIMLNDPFYADIRYNVLTNSAEYTRNGETVRWSDTDDAASRAYIEKNYGFYQKEKHTDALRLLFKSREYNPIIEIIDSIRWDGVPRCEVFLKTWANVDDNPYTREVSRLIFAGGINRLYNPGCKFDDVPILIGTKQGEGKSSLIRFLAINDAYYGEVNQFDGQQSIEQLSGKWICEISELLALTKTKEVEASKAYITRAVDMYRKPYDRNTTEMPRRCVFIGSTNNSNPLRDMTGNRRFYPVVVHSIGYELYDKEKECRDYIVQCWAEARELFKRNRMPNFARRDLTDKYREAQEDALQDDFRVGAISEYLTKKNKGDYVCIRELTYEAIPVDGAPGHDPTVVESKDIGMIMQRFPDWEKAGHHRFPKYGRQRAWVKISGDGEQCELPF